MNHIAFRFEKTRSSTTGTAMPVACRGMRGRAKASTRNARPSVIHQPAMHCVAG